MWSKVQETVNYLQNNGFLNMDYAIVLGSGLGGLVNKIAIEKELEYKDIPHFPTTSVPGHSGKLILGRLADKKVVAMQGRFHYYEGWTMQEVTFPIRVFKFLEIEKLIASNASGGVNPDFSVGDIMVINDHINFMPEHPLRGKHDKKFGNRFVDMHHPYNSTMIANLKGTAKMLKIDLQEGVYLAFQGPSFETPAEYNMIRILGADAVGMSTVPEVIVARQMDMDCLGISVITDMGGPGHIQPVSHEEVQKVARESGKKMTELIAAFLANS